MALDNQTIAGSARPSMTADIMRQTGLDDPTLAKLVDRFYGRVREDSLLGPIFAQRIDNWGPHLDRMAAFWSSVALMTGRYRGAPVAAHIDLPLTRLHFDRWLDLFRETTAELCLPEGARHLVERAERIARSLEVAIGDIARDQDKPPALR